MILCALLVSLILLQQAHLSPDDINRASGTWTGRLVYLDYGSNKEVSIRSNISIRRIGESSWSFDYEYPDEPKANSKQTVVLSSDGTTLDDERVVSREALADGGLRIVTERDGEDDGRKALFRYFYSIQPGKLSVVKRVRVQGSSEFIERNRYEWVGP
jgi:hypothetical protein